MKKNTVQKLDKYCEVLISAFSYIPKARKKLLEKLGVSIANQVQQHKIIKLVVICTHNSRRSHIGQLWLQMAGQWYNMPKMETFSGGTEATAFNKNAVAALQRAGFEIEQTTSGDNPMYQLTLPITTVEVINQKLFSKTFDSAPNPNKDFMAIMVCSEADIGCPFVPGANARFAIPFDDPKRFDGTEDEAAEYDKSVREIGREFFYAIHHAAEILK